MNPSDLILGASYLIESQDEYGKPWKGEAVYLGPEETGGYPKGALNFQCKDGIAGVFMPDEVKAFAQSQESLIDQLNELYRIATKLKLYDAADWIARHR